MGLSSPTPDGNEDKHDVGIVLDEETAESIRRNISVPERITMLKTSAGPFDINIIQVYLQPQTMNILCK